MGTEGERGPVRWAVGGGSVAKGGGFYSGSEEARKRNKGKTYTPETRKKKYIERKGERVKRQMER